MIVTHLLTCRGLREFGSRGSDHPMFARLRPHSSGSAQFCGILTATTTTTTTMMMMMMMMMVVVVDDDCDDDDGGDDGGG